MTIGIDQFREPKELRLYRMITQTFRENASRSNLFFFKQKTAYEISVCKVELQRIEPAARRRPTRRGKDADGVRDVARGHLFRKRRVRCIRDRRCRHESPPTLSERPVDTLRARLHRSPAARVAELEGDATPGRVDP